MENKFNLDDPILPGNLQSVIDSKAIHCIENVVTEHNESTLFSQPVVILLLHPGNLKKDGTKQVLRFACRLGQLYPFLLTKVSKHQRGQDLSIRK